MVDSHEDDQTDYEIDTSIQEESLENWNENEIFDFPDVCYLCFQKNPNLKCIGVCKRNFHVNCLPKEASLMCSHCQDLKSKVKKKQTQERVDTK